MKSYLAVLATQKDFVTAEVDIADGEPTIEDVRKVEGAMRRAGHIGATLVHLIPLARKES